MTDEERDLMEQWILRFCEPPPVIDAELMRRVIAEQQAEPQRDAHHAGKDVQAR
nr:hypothetical protein [uncultured Brevundimonas sp.]